MAVLKYITTLNSLAFMTLNEQYRELKLQKVQLELDIKHKKKQLKEVIALIKDIELKFEQVKEFK